MGGLGADELAAGSCVVGPGCVVVELRDILGGDEGFGADEDAEGVSEPVELGGSSSVGRARRRRSARPEGRSQCPVYLLVLHAEQELAAEELERRLPRPHVVVEEVVG